MGEEDYGCGEEEERDEGGSVGWRGGLLVRFVGFGGGETEMEVIGGYSAEGEVLTYSQKLPVRLIWKAPTPMPPSANPRLVGTRIEPAEAGDQPRTEMAYTGM